MAVFTFLEAFDFTGKTILPLCTNEGSGLANAYNAVNTHTYLTVDGVFPKELLANFIKTKRAECAEMAKIPHPAEFDRYYNL